MRVPDDLYLESAQHLISCIRVLDQLLSEPGRFRNLIRHDLRIVWQLYQRVVSG